MNHLDFRRFNMKSKAYYLDLDQYIKQIMLIAQDNKKSLGHTLKMLVLIGLEQYKNHKQVYDIHLNKGSK